MLISTLKAIYFTPFALYAFCFDAIPARIKPKTKISSGIFMAAHFTTLPTPTQTTTREEHLETWQMDVPSNVMMSMIFMFIHPRGTTCMRRTEWEN